MTVSVSIVTFNNEKEISPLLKCLLSCKGIKSDCVWVVDNASGDKTTDIIEKDFPNVNLIKSPKNLGYGGGHNLAIRAVDSDIHFIVNPDIFLNSDQFVAMCEYMMTNLDVSLMGPRILNIDNTEQALPKKNPKLVYLAGSFLPFFKRFRSEYTMKNVVIDAPIEVEFCSGCFMVCRTEILKKCGGFDERYFLYFEDADLTRTMKQFGKTVFNPNFYVTHAWHRENHKSFKGIKRFVCSYLKYRKKWRKKK